MRRLAIACLWLLAVAAAHAGSWSNSCIQPVSFGQTVGNQLTAADCYWYLGQFPNDHHYTDVYVFNGAAGQQISVAMTSAAFDPFVEVYNVNEVNAAPLAGDDNGGGGTNARIPPVAGFYTLPATGTYYIWAQSSAPNAAGAYTLTLNGIATEYSRNYVQKAYVGYYGRPGDPPGENYWSNRMDGEHQLLAAIIAAFGNSAEFVRRYGNLDNAALVTKIYQQLLARDPDQAGRDYYVGELAAGRKTLQTITLDVLNGATTPPDSTIVANKLDVATYFTAKVAAGCFYGSEQDGVDLLASVTSDPAAVAAAKAAIDTRCAGSAVMQDSYPLNQLYFRLPQLLGKKVWVMGFYGSPQNNGDGVGFLVDNPLRLLANEAFPAESFARLDGTLPPDDWQGDELLVYGTVKDYGQTYGVSTVDPTPLITVTEYHRLAPAQRTDSWENTFLTLRDVPAPVVARPATARAANAPRKAAAVTGTTAQECDRSVIISGGVDANNNRARYKENILAKYNRMKDLGFTDAQIKVFYDDATTIDPTGANVPSEKASKQKIKDHFAALASEMTGSCTLTIFVTDHGTGYNAEQGYDGQRPAFSGVDATDGILYPESTFKIDARDLVLKVSSTFVLHGNSYLVAKPNVGTIRLYKRVNNQWVFIGTDTNGDGTISETEAHGEDFDGDGVGTDSVQGLSVADLEARLTGFVYQKREYDTDGDGVKDVRIRHDGTRFVIERLDGGIWKEMGRDTNGDFIIDANDGGVDWNLDGNKTGQIGFHEGINLWGKEVLWDDEFVDLVKPLSDKGIHIMVEMVQCFGGGFVPELKWLVENIFANSGEDNKNWSREDAAKKVHAVDELSFVDNLQGIDTDSWSAATAAAIAADDAAAAASASGDPKNTHTEWKTPEYASQSVYQAELNNQYTVQLNVPNELKGQVYDFEFILGLQKPRWLFVGFPQNLPAGLDSELVPGGVRVFGNQPIPDELIFRIAVSGATVTDAIRIEYTDVAHKRLGYTNASPGTPQQPPYLMLGSPLVCIDHFNPIHPSSNSTIEWLFPLTPTGLIIPNLTQVTMRVTGPGMTQQNITTTLNNALAIYFLYGINFTGNYQFQILSAQNTQTMQPILFGGVTFGTVNVTFPAEQNVGLCNPP